MMPHRRCMVCNALTSKVEPTLCGKHTYLEGRVWSFDMGKKPWQWKREDRKIEDYLKVGLKT